MALVKAPLVAGFLAALLALLATGCGGAGGKAPVAATPAKPPAPHCAFPQGWQKLANRIAADVYCPGWLPDPLTSQIGGRWNNIDSVSRDRSYLESFVWQETQIGINGVGGELHVNLRGYPGKRRDPDLPRRPQGRHADAVLRRAARARRAERDQGDALHGQPGRRPVAPAATRGTTRGRSTRCPSTSHPPLNYRKLVALPQAGARLARADPAVELDVRLTRRQVLAGAAAGVVGATGVYELVDHLAGSSPKRPVAVDRLPEQHLLEGVRIVEQENVEVLVPPLHHEVVTAQADRDARRPRRRADRPRGRCSPTSRPTTRRHRRASASRSRGGCRTSSSFVPAAATRHLPHDRRANRPALTPSRRFPSDPAETVLEANDLAILLRSDVRAHIDDALARVQRGGLFDVTSLRRGFAGGGFDGGHSLPKQMAMAAGVPGADLIPLGSELFLGFTSTQRAAFGPGKIANFETLGFVDLGPAGYFREGTHLHLSHVTEDLEAWYIDFAFDERVDDGVPARSRRAGEHAGRPAGARAGVLGRRGARPVPGVRADRSQRLDPDHVAPAGGHGRRRRHPLPEGDGGSDPRRLQHARQPVLLLEPGGGGSARPRRQGSTSSPSTRRATTSSATGSRWTACFPGGRIPFPPRDRGQGFNSILRTTHRQNFLVPPRRHRSFPLAEL